MPVSSDAPVKKSVVAHSANVSSCFNHPAQRDHRSVEFTYTACWLIKITVPVVVAVCANRRIAIVPSFRNVRAGNVVAQRRSLHRSCKQIRWCNPHTSHIHSLPSFSVAAGLKLQAVIVITTKHFDFIANAVFIFISPSNAPLQSTYDSLAGYVHEPSDVGCS